VWQRAPDAFTEFEQLSRSIRFKRGEGIPGTVWSHVDSVWIDDLTTIPNFPRAEQARNIGLHCSAAFPIVSGSDFVGVLEFLSCKTMAPDDELLSAMADIGNRLGLFVQRKRAEEKSRRHYEEKESAEAASKAKSAFLANMSHEIRTPLGAVLGFSELMLNQNLSATERSNYVSAIKRNGELLSNIISDILDISKVEADKLEIERQDVPIEDVLTDITTMLRLQAQEKGLALTIASDGQLPSHISTDPLRLRQIIINIVGNAIKFTQRGAVEVKIKQLPNKNGHPLIAFEVKDSGEGIPPEQTKKLFQAFTQADVSTKRKHGGTGLGLILSKRLANLLGGDVVLAQSEVGVGSTFTITIDPGPQSHQFVNNLVSSTQELHDALPSQGMPDDAMRLRGLKVLLVEDAPDNQVLIGRFLKMAGAQVEIANNGREAIEKTDRDQFDLLLMDLQMPVMDGYEATETLRSGGYKKPIIALTAHALKEERLRCLASGFNDHIGKPVNRHILLDSIVHQCRPRA
jgi:signal transduction histidine kinase